MWSLRSHYSVIFLPFLQRITSMCSPDDSPHNPSVKGGEWGKLSEMQVIFCELSKNILRVNDCRVPLPIPFLHPITIAKREKAAGYPKQFLNFCSQVPLTSYFCSIDKLFCPLTKTLFWGKLSCPKRQFNLSMSWKIYGVMWSFCSHCSVIFLPFLRRITSKCSPDDSSHNPSRRGGRWGRLSEIQVIFCELT